MSFVRRIIAALVLALLPLGAGCYQDSAAPQGTPVTTQPPAERIDQGQENPAAANPPQESTGGFGPAEKSVAYPAPEDHSGGTLKEETWDAYTIGGQRIGYACNRIAEVTENGQLLTRTTSQSLLAMRRLGQSITQRMSIASWETAAGELVRFETSMTSGAGEVRTVGSVSDGRLTIETSTLGKTQKQSLPWNSACGGFFATEQSLRKQPLQPGEKRTINALLPLFNVPGETKLAALDYETVKLPSGERKLLKVNSTIQIGKQAIESVLWIDERGETLKSLVLGLEQESYRTTRADALLNVAGGELDLMLSSVVKLKKPLADPSNTRRVVYRAQMKSGKIAGAFANCLSQQVELLGERAAQITVIAVRPNDPAGPTTESSKPTDADRAPNNMIQSDDPMVVELAMNVAPDEQNPWQLACRLEKFVDETIQKKNFSQAFATAAEVASSREGDCTEHAVLLAALCRARKIPARVAFGLVYYPPQQGFAYHMWNEVWTGDRWVALDGTLGLGGIGADHIKLADSDLNDGGALATMLPVVQLMGQLELEVVKVE